MKTKEILTSLKSKITDETFNLDFIRRNEETVFFLLTNERLTREEAVYLQNRFQEIVDKIKGKE